MIKEITSACREMHDTANGGPTGNGQGSTPNNLHACLDTHEKGQAGCPLHNFTVEPTAQGEFKSANNAI